MREKRKVRGEIKPEKNWKMEQEKGGEKVQKDWEEWEK